MPPAHAILVLNSGSSSLKFALFGASRELPCAFSGVLERIGLDQGYFVARDADRKIVLEERCELPDHDAALSHLLPALEARLAAHTIVAAGHRVVHGGSFMEHRRVSAEMLATLRGMTDLAPLHLPGNIAGLESLRRTRPDLAQFACFDTAFHRALHSVARMTGLPRELTHEGIRRFGFHGLSYEYIVEVLRAAGVDLMAERIVIAHLGNGASMCALRQGQSIETTMGFSTLPGLMMGTRPGDVDPGILLHILRNRGMNAGELSSLLYERSGLLGVSGLSSDMRELIARRDDPAASEAIDLFCYRARYHLGALIAVLGGLDRLVFTGGIGANAAAIREGICERLADLGIEIDAAANAAGAHIISRRTARVTIQAVPSNEEVTIARHVWRLSGHDAAQQSGSHHDEQSER